MQDWVRFLTTHGVEHTAQKENVSVQCPFCGLADQGQHLAISLLGRGWRCFRNPQQHRGRSYVRLVSALLRCSEERSRELLGVDAPVSLPTPDNFKSQWRKQLGLSSVPETTQLVGKLSLPKEFKPLSEAKRSPFASMFWAYLEKRGYTPEQARWAAFAYEMHYCTSGPYAHRLILPVRDAQGKLLTWTGRSIKKDAEVRYMSLRTRPSEDDPVCALEPPGNLLLGLSLLWKADPARCLIVCEGPFDCISISTLGHRTGVWGACLFGVNVSEAQSDLLDSLQRRFPKMKLIIDPDARLRVLNLRQRLPRRCQSVPLLQGLKDPGELIALGEEGSRFVKELAV